MTNKTWVENLHYPLGMMRWVFESPVLLYLLGLGFILGQPFLVTTTTGRKSGQPHRTVIEFQEFNKCNYIFSSWGMRINWYGDIEENFVMRFNPDTGLLGNMEEAVRYRDSGSGAKKVLCITRSVDGEKIEGTKLDAVGSATWLDQGKPWALFKRNRRGIPATRQRRGEKGLGVVQGWSGSRNLLPRGGWR